MNDLRRWMTLLTEAEQSPLLRLLGRLPRMTLPTGTNLFHGTDAAVNFRIPRGPAWFSLNQGIAGRWAGWGSTTRGARRVLAYQTTQDIVLMDWREPGFTYQDYSALSVAAANEDEASPYQIANALRGHVAGWHGGNEIMLCDPKKYIKLVGRQTATGKPFGEV